MLHQISRRAFGSCVLAAPLLLDGRSACAAEASFIDALHTDHPASDRAEKVNLYGWLVGSWNSTIVAHEPNGRKHTNRGEIHAGWEAGVGRPTALEFHQDQAGLVPLAGRGLVRRRRELAASG